MIERDLLASVQIRVIPDSAGTTGSGAYLLNLSSVAVTGTTTAAGANSANSDSVSEAGREITLIDTAATMTAWPGRRVLITSGPMVNQVMQIVSVSGTTATCRFLGTATGTVIGSGSTYKVLADYEPGQKIIITGVNLARKVSDGLLPESAGGIVMRVLINGATFYQAVVGYSSNQGFKDQVSADNPIVIPTVDGPPTIQFSKLIIGTTAFGTNLRFYVTFLVL